MTRCKPIDFGFRKAYTEVDGNKLVIYVEGFCPEYIIQGDKLTFAITSCITYPTTINNAVLNVNGTEFNLIKFGNVKWDQIKSRVAYCGIFGTEEPTITILNKLPCSKFDYTVYSTTSTTEEES